MTKLNEKEILEYSKKINKLGKWYQPIQFTEKLITPSEFDINSSIYGLNKWNKIIRKNLPKNLKNKKILELGCASGLYSVLCAKEGANVTAIELNKTSFKQSKLTAEIFSKIDGIDYTSKINFLNENFMDHKWENYDIVLAFNVFYWITAAFMGLNEKEIEKHSNKKDIEKLFSNLKKHANLLVIQTDENKYYVRKKGKYSTFLTHSKTIVPYLKKKGFKNIQISKPINLWGALRTIWSFLTWKRKGMAEVDLHRPWLYSRPIITAKNN